MKQLILSFLCFAAAFMLCASVIRLYGRAGAQKTESAADPAETAAIPEPAAPSETFAQPVTMPAENSFDQRFHLPVLHEGKIVSMSLYRYVLGALLGEMPTSFEQEALKAQATACRTYALRQYLHRKHDSAAVCTEPGCCMNWVDPDEFLVNYGKDTFERAQTAVRDTDAVAIWYLDEPICATFFSCACGRTEDASAVWGGEVPYLRSVESADPGAPYAADSVFVSFEEFAAILQAENEMAVFPEDGSGWIGEASYTNGGGVDTWELGGCIYTGVQLRRLFGLRSTDFSIDLTEDGVLFTTHGFGHRVGLSQYGANAMAEEGRDYAEILQWYYTGTVIKNAENLSHN